MIYEVTGKYKPSPVYHSIALATYVCILRYQCITITKYQQQTEFSTSNRIFLLLSVCYDHLMSSANENFPLKLKMFLCYQCITITRCCQRMKFSTTNRKLFPWQSIQWFVSETFSSCSIEQVVFTTFLRSSNDCFVILQKLKRGVPVRIYAIKPAVKDICESVG